MDLQTKVVGNNDYQYNETKINSAIIAVFHKDGSVNTVRRAEFATGAPTKVDMKIKSGESDVYVITNSVVDLDAITSITALNELTIPLLQTESNLPMSGSAKITVEPGKTVESTIDLVRINAKVSVESIVDALATNGYPGYTMKIKSVFLYNVPTISTLIQPLATSSLQTDYNGIKNLKDGYYGNYDRHYFYMFEGMNRLVIQTEINGKTYYYPIDIPAIRNTHYKYTVTIKGLGTNNPGDNYEESSVLDLKLTVKDWELEPSNDVFN